MSAITVLVTGAHAAAREAAIAARIVPGTATALLLEGLPDGIDRFAHAADWPQLRITRIAPGCFCCIGNLTMQVTLNRLLRQRPAYLFISMIATPHLVRVQEWLRQPPYATLLTLAETMHCDNHGR
ncbi:MAG TPA: GTPase [Paucimonas sp.]|nr:GTPase [Paucimonas sp.]HJW54250.1 GTPase [Burkholderiaceae bacterium]